MKTTLALFLVVAALTTSAQTNSVHDWTLNSGAVVSGDYFTSGKEMVVIKSHGTNCLLKISELSSNDWLYFQDCKAAQRQRQLDAEAAQMRAAGWIEFTSDLIALFPEKVRENHGDGIGTINTKKGWMDATFDDFDKFTGNADYYLSFSVRDSQGKRFDYCLVTKRLNEEKNFDQRTPNPLVNVASGLKSGDRIRLYGHCDDDIGLSSGDMVHHRQDSHCSFYVDRIVMIESVADAATAKKGNPDLENTGGLNPYTGLPNAPSSK